MNHIISISFVDQDDINTILGIMPEGIKVTSVKQNFGFGIIIQDANEQDIRIVEALICGFKEGKSQVVLDKSNELISNLESITHYIGENKLVAKQYVQEFATNMSGSAPVYFDDEKKIEKFRKRIQEELLTFLEQCKDME